MKKILVPIDFSDESLYAFDMACQISNSFHQEIVLIHVIELPSHFIESGIFTNYNNLYEGLFEELKQKNENQLQELITQKENLAISYEIILGHFTENIIQYCEDMTQNIGLIIMGTKGTSGFNEFLIGSNTEKIVRYANCPVLTIHNKCDDFAPKNFVLASHFENIDSLQMGPFINFISLFPKATIHLVRINTPSDFMNSIDAEKAITEFINFWNIKNYTLNLFDYENFEEGLLVFQELKNADCIILGTHKRTGLSQLFLGSHTEHIVNKFNKPILSFKI